MRRLLLGLVLAAGCASPPRALEGPVRLASFSSDATPPIGHPLINGKPLEAVDAPLLRKR